LKIGIAPSSLIVLAPVLPADGDSLVATLTALDEGERSLFAQAPGTHFGRFVFVPTLTGADGQPLPESGAYLLLAADFDTDPAEWTTALCWLAGGALDSVMRHCQGYPGSHDPAAVLSYLEAHRVPAGFTVAGYRRATVTEVREALRVGDELRALAARAQAERLAPGELRRAWNRVWQR
jgi:hypothetical protein